MLPLSAVSFKVIGGLCLLLIVAVVSAVVIGCQAKTVTNPDGTTTVISGQQQAYNAAKVIADNVEAVANALAAAGVLPQIDVTLGEQGLNEALALWQQAINNAATNTPVPSTNPAFARATAPTVSVEEAKANFYLKLADMTRKIASAQAAHVQQLKR